MKDNHVDRLATMLAFHEKHPVTVALRARIAELEAALRKTDDLMIRLARVFSCRAYENHKTGPCTCGVEAQHNANDAALSSSSSWLAEHDAQVRKEERERCAKIAESRDLGPPNDMPVGRWHSTQADWTAVRIRALPDGGTGRG